MASSTKRRPAPSRPTTRRKAATTPARTSRARTPKRPPVARRLLASVAAALSRHGQGALGAALAGTAVVTALVLWMHVPFTGFAVYLAGVTFGLARYGLPLLLATPAAVMLSGRRQHLARLGVGLFLLTTAVAGMLHLLRYEGGGSTFDGWRRAGGFLGGMAATPLRALGGPWAAGLVLAAAGALGLL
ncbi:MAG: hypothetical protein ACRD0C_15550, partial [Acidimicrobiia bacterium]